MECKACDSKKLFKVFDASRRKRNRKKREGDSNSVASDDSNSAINGHGISSAKGSLQNITVARAGDVTVDLKTRERDRSLSVSRSRGDNTRVSPSPRRHRRCPREGISLALKAGNPSPRSDTQDAEEVLETLSKDQDSSIYAYLEDALKREKKKYRHMRRFECRTSREKDGGREREASVENGERRHRHRRRQEDAQSPDLEKPIKEKPAAPSQIDQTVLLETFAKLCATLNEKTEQLNQLKRSLSHKSLQCETVSGHESDVDHHPVKLRSQEHSRENIPLSRTRTHANVNGRVRSHENIAVSNTRLDKKGKCECCPTYENIRQRYTSKIDMRAKESEIRYRDRPFVCYRAEIDTRNYRHYDSKDTDRQYEDDRRRYVEAKTSRSFDVERPSYEERRPTSRSDSVREKRYTDRSGKDLRKYDERKDKFFEEKIDARERHFTGKERLSKRNIERFERNSVVSREDSYRERDKYSERERDSGLSVADETSTVSGKSTYLRVVKQEIAEQREAMDKMMNLWKELMRCFKGISQTQKPDTSTYEKAETAHDSAAAQLRLWRECMRRYETVARDVGDTDARLMEEINKQRSEMAEMSTMWQECLQRYRDMSDEFNNLKQQVALASESPTRDTTPAPPLCVDNLTLDPMMLQPGAQYRVPPNYANLVPPPPPAMAYPSHSPLRSRASAPPAWWWCDREQKLREERDRAICREEDRARSERDRAMCRDEDRDRGRSPRHHTPDSRGSRDRRRRHKDRTDSRSRNDKYKEKSKPGAAKSEHNRHRKR